MKNKEKNKLGLPWDLLSPDAEADERVLAKILEENRRMREEKSRAAAKRRKTALICAAAGAFALVVIFSGVRIMEKHRAPTQAAVPTNSTRRTGAETAFHGTESHDTASHDTAGAVTMQANYDLTELTEMCPFIVKGTCRERLEDKFGSPVYQISVEKQFQGSELPEKIPVETVGKELQEGGAYYFLLQGIDSVYTEETYYQAEDIVSVDGTQHVHSNRVQEAATLPLSDWEETLQAAIKTNPFSGKHEYLGYYLHSDDLAEICGYAQYVVLLEPTAHLFDGVDRENYSCRVVSMLKGFTEEQIQAPFKTETVTVGERYIALLIKQEGGGYTLAAPRAVFPEDSPEADEVRAILGK